MSSSVGTMILVTVSSVKAWRASSTTSALNSLMRLSVNRCTTYPMEPARPKISGGSDSRAKKAASAASPVTRLRRQALTVETIRRQTVSRTWTHSGSPVVVSVARRGLVGVGSAPRCHAPTLGCHATTVKPCELTTG